MKAFILYHWNRLCTWLERVERLQREIADKDAEIARLRGWQAALQSEVELTRQHAKGWEGKFREAQRANELAARWIARSRRVGEDAAAGSVRELLQHANHR